MPTTKSDLIEKLAERLCLSKGKAELIVKCIFDSMTNALQQDERIEIRGFGSFEVRNYKAYEGRNPRTGETVHVAPKKLPFFKVGKELRERINGDPPAEDPEAEANGAPSATAETPSRTGSEARAEHELSEPVGSPWPSRG